MEKIVKNNLIDKNSKTPKNDRILKLPEVKQPEVKTFAPLTSLTKTQEWESYTKSVLTYGAQVWPLTKSNIKRIQATQRAKERNIRGKKKKEKIRNTQIRKETKCKNIGYSIKKLKWTYAGHIMRQNEGRWERKAEEWVPYGQQRQRGRAILRWKDELKKEMRPKWRSVAKNRRI